MRDYTRVGYHLIHITRGICLYCFSLSLDYPLNVTNGYTQFDWSHATERVRQHLQSLLLLLQHPPIKHILSPSRWRHIGTRFYSPKRQDKVIVGAESVDGSSQLFFSLSPYIIEKGNETGESFEVEERASKSSLHPNCPETNGVRDLNGRAPRNGFCRFQSTRQKFSKSRLWCVV